MLFDVESESDISSTLSVLKDPGLIAQTGDTGIHTGSQLIHLRYSSSLPAHWTPLNQQPTTSSVWNVHLGSHDSTGQMIGFINVSCRHKEFPPDIGWVILPAHQGKGYAGEAAKRVADYFVHEFQGGFINAEPKIPLVACIKVGNEVSEKVARRLGQVESGWVQYQGQDDLSRVWAVEGLGCKYWEGDVRLKWQGWRSNPLAADGARDLSY